MKAILDKLRSPWSATRLGALLRSRYVAPTRAGARYLSGGLLAVVLLGSVTNIVVDKVTGLPQGAAFRIGDATTSEQQLDHRVEVMSALYGLQRPSDARQAGQFNRAAAKAVAVSDVLQDAAAKQGIVVAQKNATDQLDKIIAQSYPAGRQDFITKLGRLGISEQDVLGEIKRQMTTSRLYQSVVGDVPPITDAQLKAGFDKRKAQMVTPQKRHLRNIAVRDENTAKEILREARGGADFASLAGQKSQDGSTRNSGGDLGTVTADQLEKSYADAAFGGAPNSLFGPVKTQAAWNVGQVVQVVPGTPLSFDQVKDQLRTRLNTERKLGRWNDWLAGKIKDADVEYADAYRPADPSSPPSMPQ
jgi:peptidyl-prolyl cis-trans isomerase C